MCELGHLIKIDSTQIQTIPHTFCEFLFFALGSNPDFMRQLFFAKVFFLVLLLIYIIIFILMQILILFQFFLGNKKI